MRIPAAFSVALLAALSMCLVACSKSEKPGAVKSQELTTQLTALDKAYQAGLLTPEEYQAKKAAFAGAAAKQAVVEETASTPASPSTSSATPVGHAPDASRPAPVGVPSVRANASAPSSPDGHSYRMKMVKVIDAQGYAQPMVSATMLIPTDWQSQGATLWVKDKCNPIQTSVRATGPDGRAFEIFPAYNWLWADDPTFLRQTAAQQARLGAHPCDVTPAMGATEYLKRNLGKLRPNAKLGSIEPATKLMQALQDQARQGEQAAAQYRLQKRIRPDVVRAHITYDLNGKSMEEWIVAATVITGTAGLKGEYNYSCRGTMIAERAPRGQLESSEKLFDLINSTFRVDQAWQARVTQSALAIQQIRQKGAQDRAKIVAKNAEDIRNIQRESYENQQRGQDQSAAGYSQYLRGTETYQNPATGQKVDLDSKYGNAWTNSNGEYLLSDQAGFDPNTVLQGSWTQMQHAKP